MIVKVKKGADMAGAIRYLAADKEALKREAPHVVAGLDREGQALDADAVREIARELDAARVLSGTEVPDGHVWHCSLTLDEAEGRLGDDRWREIAEEFMERVRFGRVRWVAVHHGPNAGGGDHVHIVASMVREDGKRASEWRSLTRASDAAGAIEQKHGLNVVEGRLAGVGGRGHHRAEVEQADRLGKAEPARDVLERLVRATAESARSEQEFVETLRAAGVKVTPRMAPGSQTEVAGYSYRFPDSAKYGGGTLARDLTLPRLRERWQTEPAGATSSQDLDRTLDAISPSDRGAWAKVEHDLAGAYAELARRHERTPGPLADMAREHGRGAQVRAHVARAAKVAVPVGAGLALLLAKLADRDRGDDHERTTRLVATLRVLESTSRRVQAARAAQGQSHAAARLERVVDERLTAVRRELAAIESSGPAHRRAGPERGAGVEL